MSYREYTNQFDNIRVNLESALKPPAMLLVSSALANDGKGLLSRGLADSMQAAGYETLLINADRQHALFGSIEAETVAEITTSGLERFVCKTGPQTADTIDLSSETLRHRASTESLTDFLSIVRDCYQYTIIDATTMLDDNLALLLAIAADAVLLAVRQGRRVRSADKELTAALERHGVTVMGVVAITPATIRADNTETLISQRVMGVEPIVAQPHERSLPSSKRRAV